MQVSSDFKLFCEYVHNYANTKNCVAGLDDGNRGLDVSDLEMSESLNNYCSSVYNRISRNVSIFYN